ncbi:HAD family hydrolase [Streptomyces sp. WSLK1-5]|uniref:HAD family hydrolase n=1 Tax=unclassified Streptomyces TaxID=2593676 RepID=UPI00378CD898
MRFALFDLDGTLVDRRAAFTDAVASLAQDHAYSPEIERWLLTELADRADRSAFDRLRTVFSLNESADHLWRAYVDRMAASVSCHPGVLAALGELRNAGWTIGIATNGASDIQRAKITATGISDLVDGIAVSGDLEIRKPDRRLFELAAARCGLTLDKGGWMIGDNPTADIGGAQQAGLHTIWLHGRPWPNRLAAADHVVDDAVGAITILLNTTSE